MMSILKSSKQLLKAWQHRPDAMLELLQIVEGTLIRCISSQLSSEIALAEHCPFAVLTHANVDRD